MERRVGADLAPRQPLARPGTLLAIGLAAAIAAGCSSDGGDPGSTSVPATGPSPPAVEARWRCLPRATGGSGRPVELASARKLARELGTAAVTRCEGVAALGAGRVPGAREPNAYGLVVHVRSERDLPRMAVSLAGVRARFNPQPPMPTTMNVAAANASTAPLRALKQC